MSKFYQRYVTGTKKASEEEKLLSKAPTNVARQVDPTAMALSHVTKRPLTSSSKPAASEVVMSIISYVKPISRI